MTERILRGPSSVWIVLIQIETPMPAGNGPIFFSGPRGTDCERVPFDMGFLLCVRRGDGKERMLGRIDPE